MTAKLNKALTRRDFVEDQQLRARRPRLTPQDLQAVRQQLRAACEAGARPLRVGALRARVHRVQREVTLSRKGIKPLRRANARSLDALHGQVLTLLLQGIAQGLLTPGSSAVTREAIARRLGMPNHQVEQVFCRLRVQRLLVQERNDGPHDSYRAYMFGGSMTGWAPTYWRLVNPEVWAQVAGDFA